MKNYTVCNELICLLYVICLLFLFLQKSKVSITGSIKLSQKHKLSERHCSMTEKIEVLRVALDSLGWSRKDVCDVITSRLHLAFPVDHLWAGKKCKNLKFTSALGVLLTLGEVRDTLIFI